MNILFISPSNNPFVGAGWGATQRTNLLFEACLELGHVDVVAFKEGVESSKENCRVLWSQTDSETMEGGRSQKLMDMLLSWRPNRMFPRNVSRSTVVDEIMRQSNDPYDFIVCRYVSEAMECGLMDYAERLVIDVDDNPVDTERIYAQTARTFRNRLFHRVRSFYIDRTMRTIQKRCFFTFYSNPNQAKFPNSAYLPNIPFYNFEIPAVDFSCTSPRILFVGNLSYGPNRDGIDHFVRFVFPLIRLIVPNAELHLVGGCNDQVWVEKLQMTNGVLYRGFVDDLLMEYAAARVTVAPIYSGTGTNIKVLESMQARRPCITTICGFRGFDGCFSNNRELVVVDDDEEFSEQVVSLLTNIDRNHRMAEMAYQCVVTHFTREAFNSIVQLHLKKQ